MDSDKNAELEQIELRLLLEGVFLRYGYDFRDYAPASLKRRIMTVVAAEKMDTISALLARVLHDPECMSRLLKALSINVTAMFRDPEFYRAVRKEVIPILRTFPFIRVWIAGCATGEEAYSIAILLHEEGIFDRCRIYATDMNSIVVKQAAQGIFPLTVMRDYTANYIRAGGLKSFSDWYTANYDFALFSQELRSKIVFSHHNLVTDGSMNEFNLILCRNVMIYFNQTLQNRVHKLLYESLSVSGILGLGDKEIIKFSGFEDRYAVLDGTNRLYKRIG